MANLQYIGARYVPLIYTNPDDGSATWKSGVEYEALTIVVENGDSYTSKKAVPDDIGQPSLNPEYWVKTGDFNASLISLQNEVSDIENKMKLFKYTSVKDFGAQGDGITEDGDAIREAIDYCNTNGTTLYFPKGKYLYSFSDPVDVECSIDFGGSEIVLKGPAWQTHAFNVGIEPAFVEFDATSIEKYKVNEISLFNRSFSVVSPVSIGQRWGTGAEAYYSRFITTDENGYITNGPYMPDIILGTYRFKNVRKIDDDPIEISNGAISAVTNSGYNASFIYIRRNFVTVKNLFITYPKIDNAQYRKGIISAAMCCNCVFDSIVAVNPYGITASGYVLEFGECYNCDVRNVICIDKVGMSWGSFATSWCDNMHFENCVTERIDAHNSGTFDVHNCSLFWANFSGGYGNVIFDNCQFTCRSYNNSQDYFISNRDDYLWYLSGSLIIRNCTFYNSTNSQKIGVYIGLPRTTGEADPSVLNFEGLKINVENCHFDNDISPFGEDIRVSGYTSLTDVVFKNCEFNTNWFNYRRTSGSESYPFNSITYDGCYNKGTSETYLTYSDCYKQITFKNSTFDGKLSINSASSVVLSVINNVLPELLCRSSNVVRVLQNMVTDDTALTIGPETPTYTLKSDNIIIAATNTNQSTWE